MVVERFLSFAIFFFLSDHDVFQMLILWYVAHYNSGVFRELKSS